MRAIVVHAGTAGFPVVKPVARRPSRWRSDYLIVTVVFNFFVIGAALLCRGPPIVLVFALAAFVLFNLRLAWRMWAVMDDY